MTETPEGWLERSPDEATLNNKAREFIASIDRTLLHLSTALKHIKNQEQKS